MHHLNREMQVYRNIEKLAYYNQTTEAIECIPKIKFAFKTFYSDEKLNFFILKCSKVDFLNFKAILKHSQISLVFKVIEPSFFATLRTSNVNFWNFQCNDM